MEGVIKPYTVEPKTDIEKGIVFKLIFNKAQCKQLVFKLSV